MSTAPRHALIPVTLLTGFLGSGKTTLLNNLVRQPALADALVIINEFGEIPLDHALVANSTENLVMEMSSGCLCCTIRGDLVQTLRDITWRFSRGGQRQFRRVLIETTGLADPAPIIHTLMTHPMIASRYRLDGIVATVDLASGSNTLDREIEATKQAAMADCILLTKADLATDEQQNDVLRRLKTINPAAPRWRVGQGEIEASKLLDLGLFSTEGKGPDVERWLREEAYTAPGEDHSEHEHGHGHDHHHHDINRHGSHIRAFCYYIDTPLSHELLEAWLETLTSFAGSNMLRLKGILNIEGNEKPVVIHGVQHMLHPLATLPTWPSDDRRSRLVFITRDLERETVDKLLQALNH